MMIRNVIAFTIILISLNNIYGQQYEMKKQLSQDEKKELLDISKEILKVSQQIRYSILPAKNIVGHKEMDVDIFKMDSSFMNPMKQYLSDGSSQSGREPADNLIIK